MYARTVTCLLARLADIEKQYWEPTKKVLRLASEYGGLRSTLLSGIEETNVHKSETKMKFLATQ